MKNNPFSEAEVMSHGDEAAVGTSTVLEGFAQLALLSSRVNSAGVASSTAQLR